MWKTTWSVMLNAPHPTSSAPVRARHGTGRRAARLRAVHTSADDDHQPGDEVEDAVPEGVRLEAGEVVGRHPGHHEVVPLQHLVQDDAVEERAQPEAGEQQRTQLPQAPHVLPGRHGGRQPVAVDGNARPAAVPCASSAS